MRVVVVLMWMATTDAATAQSSVPEQQWTHLGQPLNSAKVASYSTVILPDGTGLPPGSGTATSGRTLFAERCSRCHGTEGRGGAGGELAGGDPDLRRDPPDQTIGTYWPFAPTLFDFIRRAMPMDAPWSLSDDEVYALTAYLLRLNAVPGVPERLDAKALARVVMPNRHGFVGIDAPFPASPSVPCTGCSQR